MAKIADHRNNPTLPSSIEMTSTTQAWIEKMVGLGIGNFTATICTKEDRQNGKQRQTPKKEIEKTFHDQYFVARLDENISNGNHIGNILKENLAGYGPESKALNGEKEKTFHDQHLVADSTKKSPMKII